MLFSLFIEPVSTLRSELFFSMCKESVTPTLTTCNVLCAVLQTPTESERREAERGDRVVLTGAHCGREVELNVQFIWM